MSEEINLMESKVGDKEVPKNIVKPAKVLIAGVTIKTKDKDKKTMSTPLVEFHVKHPDKEKTIKVSKLKFLDGNDVRVVSFWAQLDDDKKFFKGSAVEKLLTIINCETLAECEGKEIETVEESKTSGYLCFKAY